MTTETLGPLCGECAERVEGGYPIHADCCRHENVETLDEADGSRPGIAHDWRSTCRECGSEVMFDGESWEVAW